MTLPGPPSPSPAPPPAVGHEAPRSSTFAKVALLAMKVGPKLVPVLKLLTSAKFLLLFASLAGYAWLWGPLFGAGFLALIAIHESGHVWAMRRAGIRTKGMYFLPFMGAVAVVDENLKSRWQEFWLTIMGPVFGLAGVLAVLGLWAATGHSMFLVLALAGAFLNLVNLLPILPLDGGRILRSITLSAVRGRAGFAIVAAVTLAAAVGVWFAGFRLFALFSLLGLWELSADYRHAREVVRWRDENPLAAHAADRGELRDAHGNVVEAPRLITPMRPGVVALAALATLATGAALAAVWLFTVDATGVNEFADVFR